jgi:hypothetical protein
MFFSLRVEIKLKVTFVMLLIHMQKISVAEGFRKINCAFRVKFISFALNIKPHLH